jgi:hypothetical protein
MLKGGESGKAFRNMQEELSKYKLKHKRENETK